MEQAVPKTARMNEDEIDLWAMTQMFWRQRLLIAAVTGVGTVGSVIMALSQPNIYTATATIMPADSSSDRLSSALSSLGALGGLASQTGVGLKGTVSDKFVVLLKSRSMAEKVITKHNLLPILFPERWDAKQSTWKAPDTPFPWVKETGVAKAPTMHQALRRLRSQVVTKAEPKAGLVDISVENKEPEVAARIANYYVIELNAYLKGASFTSAKQNKDFLEEQLNKVTGELKTIENDLKGFQEENKLVSLDAQTEASVQAYATLKSQLMAKEMEISLQEKSTSESDVFLLGLRQEVTQLKEKLAALEGGASEGLVSFKDAPTLGLQFARYKRDLTVRQKVFELLTQQYELAKIEEAKEALTFQVIDEAVPPDQKSKPKRLVIVVLGFFTSLGVGAGGAMLLAAIQNRRKTTRVTA